MESENTALVYLICLLLKEDVRPGYIPNIDFIFYIKYMRHAFLRLNTPNTCLKQEL